MVLRNNSFRYILPFLIPAVIAALCVLATLYTSQSQNPEAVMSKKYWSDEISSKGASAAYRELADDISAWEPGKQHAAAHVFGSALYAQSGIDGLSTCDARFADGCTHELVAEAVTQEGLGIVERLADACGPNTDTCMHAAGHGILAYFGYASSSIHEAIQACKHADPQEIFDGCEAGAFMEYNERTTLGVDGKVRKNDNANDPGALCKQFSGKAAANCALYIPQWWLSVLADSDVSRMFAQMDRECRLFADKTVKQACFKGIGWTAPAIAKFDLLASGALCDDAAISQDEKAWCRTYAANLFFITGSKADGSQLCAPLQKEVKSTCERSARTRSINDFPQ